jgi:hypothetical protein
VQSTANNRYDGGHVRSPRELGNDPAKGAMHVDRGLDDRGANTKLFVDDGSRRLITTRLDAQD